MKEQYATKRLLLIPANKSLTEAVTDYYVRNRTFFQAYDPVCEEEFFTHRYQRVRLDLDEQNAMQAQGYRFYLVKKEQPQQNADAKPAAQESLSEKARKARENVLNKKATPNKS